MVVQSIALPKTSGSTRDQELTIAGAVAAPAPATAGRRFSSTTAFVPALIATQVAWLALLGYGVVRFLL